MPIVLDSLLVTPGPPAPPVTPPVLAGGQSAAMLLSELGMRMGDYAEGIVTTLGTSLSYLDDNTRNEPDDTFRFGWLTYTALPTSSSVTNNALERRITGYDGSVNVGRFLLGNGAPTAGLAAPCFPGDTYVVHMRWSRRRKLAAINRAIRRLPQNFWRRIEDTSITTADRIWTYPLPVGMVNLHEVWIQTSTNLSGPGMLAEGQDGRGFPFQRLSNWSVRTDVQGSAVTRVLQLFDLPAWPRTLRLIGTGIQPILQNDWDIASVGEDDYDQRLGEYLLSYASGYLWVEGADGAPIDQSARSVELAKLNMQLAAELRNELIMPPPALEVDTPDTVGRRGWGDNPAWMAALHTPGFASR